MNPVAYLATRAKPAIERHLLKGLDKDKSWGPLKRFRPAPEQRITRRHHRLISLIWAAGILLLAGTVFYAHNGHTITVPWLPPLLLLLTAVPLYGACWLFFSIQISCWNRRAARLSGDTSHDREFGGGLVFLAISVYLAPWQLGDAAWEWYGLLRTQHGLFARLAGHGVDYFLYLMAATSLAAWAFSLWAVYLFATRRRQTLAWINAMVLAMTLQALCVVVAFAVGQHEFYGAGAMLHSLVAYVIINVYAVFSTRYQAIFVR